MRGFVLPSGKAFVYEPENESGVMSREIGITNLRNGIKKILKAPGDIEFEFVRHATTSPAQSSDSTDS